MSSRNLTQQKVIAARDDNAGLGLSCEKTYVQVLKAPKTRSPVFTETVEYHHVDTESFALFKPGHYCFPIPSWAQHCVISLAGGGGGGSGASVDSKVIRAGSGGGGASCIILMPIDLTTSSNGSVHTKLFIYIGDGGAGGNYNNVGQNGLSSYVLLGENIVVTAPGGMGASLDQYGKGGKSCQCKLNGSNGSVGGTTIGSQGSPQGGAGGNSFFALGGSGGIPTSASNAEGSAGKMGGSGGGGGSSWGVTGKGGKGGCGLAELQWFR